MENIKGSADLHDHIDKHIDSKPKARDTSNMVDSLIEHPDADRSHMDKVANHLMTQLTPDSDHHVTGSLENVLQHKSTEAKTVNSFLANANATEHAHSNVTIGGEALNKVGVDQNSLVTYLSKHIENGSSSAYDAHSDVLKGLSDKAKSIKDPEQATEYDNFISRAYGQGPRDQSDHDKLKYVLKNALKSGQQVDDLFDDNKNVSHNDLLEMYHQIPTGKRKKLAAGDQYSHGNFLMDHPNIDKDYLASAALDQNHELHKNALKSKNLPTHVLDRLISDDNQESLKTAMEGQNLAPENADKLAEYGVGRKDIHDEYDSFLSNNADKLSKEAAAKVYSGLRGAGQDGHARVLAQADGSSDEMFLDSLNRGENPSMYGRDKVSPELANTLLAHEGYHKELMRNDDVPEDVKNKIAEQGKLAYKDAIGYHGQDADKLPLSVQKTYFNQMTKKSKINSTLMNSIYQHEGATAEDKQQVLDAAVKGFKAVAKKPVAAEFFARNIASADPQVHEAFAKLTPENQGHVLNSFTDSKHGDRGEFLKNGDIDSATAKQWLQNPHINENSRDALLENPSVDLHTYVAASDHNSDDKFSWNMNKKADTVKEKIDQLPHASRQEFLNKYSNGAEFESAPTIVRTALLRHPDMDTSSIPMSEKFQQQIDNHLESEDKTNVIKKLKPDQATEYFAMRSPDKMGHDVDWSAIHDAHPDATTDYLSRGIGENNSFHYYFDSGDNVHKLGHKLIDKHLEDPKLDTGAAQTLGQLYNPNQDPGHQRLINMLGAYGHDSDLIDEMHEGLDKAALSDEDNKKRITVFDKPDVLANIGPRFAPGGDMDNPAIWNKLEQREHLPKALKAVAAYTNARVATSHLATIGHEQGHDAEAAEAIKMSQDPRTSPKTFDKLIEHMRVIHDPSTMDAGKYHAHATALSDMILHGMQNNKVANDNIAMDALGGLIKDTGLPEEYRTKTAMDAVNMIQSQPAGESHWKSRNLSALANNPGLPEATRQHIGDQIIDNAVTSKDYKALRALGTDKLLSDNRIWQNPQFKDANSFKDYMKLANDTVIDWQMSGDAKHPEAWMHASKAATDYVMQNPDELQNSWVTENMGILLFGGAESDATRPVSLAMVTAITAKTCEAGGSVQLLMKRWNDGDSSYQEAMMASFKGLNGNGTLTIPHDKATMLPFMRAAVTNEAQAASVVKSGVQDKESAADMVNYSHMVSEKGQLGSAIASRITDDHPFLSQDNMHNIMNHLAEKDTQAYRLVLDNADDSVYKSAKSMSSIAMSMPKFTDRLAEMSTDEQDMHNVRATASTMLEFSGKMFRVHANRYDLMDEGMKVARDHYVGNMIDGLTALVGSPNVSKNSATGIHRELRDEMDGALPLEYQLNKEQVGKLMNLSSTIMAGQHTGAYSEAAVAAVNHGAFRAGQIDSADMHTILAENPAAIYSAVRNKKFTMDHMQHYRPDQTFEAWKVDVNRNQSLIDSVDKTNASFFGALADRAADFGEEDKTKILQKGLDYLAGRHKALPVHRNNMALEGPIRDFAKKMVAATKGPTQGEMLLGHILANNVDPSSYAVLMEANLTPNQNGVVLERMFDFDGAQNLRQADENRDSGSAYFLQNLNLDKDSIKKIRDNSKLSGLEAAEAIIDNDKITDKSVKPDAVTEVIGYLKAKPNPYIRNKALKVRGITREQFDGLTADMESQQVFNPSSFQGDSTFRNPDFGGDRFRDMGITQEMKDTFKELTGKKFDGDVEKFHHGKDLEAMNSLLGMIPPNGLAWKDFKRANPKLAENQKIKNLFMSNKEMVTPDSVVAGMSNLPGSYHITFGKWNGIQRHDDDRENLVVQFNLDKSFENHIAQDPDLHKFMIDMEYMSNSGHPVAPRTMFWSRVDANSPKGWVVEEIQSDFDSTLRTLVGYAKERGSYEIGGTEYKTEQLEKFLKSFTKLLGDHVDTAHSYIEQLAKKQGVPALHMHGKKMRAELSGMDDDKEVPKWLEYKYETWPQKNGWEESDKSHYPSGKKKDKDTKTWMKRLT